MNTLIIIGLTLAALYFIYSFYRISKEEKLFENLVTNDPVVEEQPFIPEVTKLPKSKSPKKKSYRKKSNTKKTAVKADL
jgi:hypothetical protein